MSAQTAQDMTPDASASPPRPRSEDEWKRQVRAVKLQLAGSIFCAFMTIFFLINSMRILDMMTWARTGPISTMIVSVDESQLAWVFTALAFIASGFAAATVGLFAGWLKRILWR